VCIEFWSKTIFLDLSGSEYEVGDAILGGNQDLKCIKLIYTINWSGPWNCKMNQIRQSKTRTVQVVMFTTFLQDLFLSD